VKQLTDAIIRQVEFMMLRVIHQKCNKSAMSYQKLFQKRLYTLKGRGVAMIDSGVWLHHPHIGKTSVNLSLQKKDGRIIETQGGEDQIGHGTACAAIMFVHATDILLYNIKIFHYELRADIDVLLRALERALKYQVSIINLSLAVFSSNYDDHILDLCKQAGELGKVIIASEGFLSPDKISPFPENVILVRGDCSHSWGEISENGPFLTAHPFHRRLPGVSPENDFNGNSIAAAHVTGILAGIYEQY